MGWRDRDYAKWTDEERRRFLGPSSSSTSGYVPPPNLPSRSRGGGSHTSYAVAVAAVVSLALYGLGHFPAGHPLVPALHFNLGRSSSIQPGLAPTVTPSPPPVVPLNGPSSVPVHSVMTFHGPVPSGDEGPVRVLGSLNGATWSTLAVADGASGSYVARIALNQPGSLRIRIVFRDGVQAVKTILVH